ncbi:MAG: hypothetical protein Q7O66_14335, partial [Dehalococcoidia bacterium]|nr:hypothetical protein [Dehalococcoidia bacterium]
MAQQTSDESINESASACSQYSTHSKANGPHDSHLPILLGIIISIVLALPAIWPLIQPGLPQTNDTIFHLGRLIEIRESMATGDFFPRWEQPFTNGLGFPFLNFYAPLSYFFALSITFLGLGEADAFKLASALMPLLSAATMYLWVADLLRRNGPSAAGGQLLHISALGAGVVYAYAPYQLVEIYVRGALAESAALALLPLLFYTQDRLLRRPGLNPALVAALTIGALVLTHNVVALLGLAISIGYSLLSYAVERVRALQAEVASPSISRVLAYFTLSIGLGMGLSAFFWAPAMLERGFLSFQQLSTGWFSAVRHLGDSWPPVENSIVFDFRTPYRISLLQVLFTLPGLAFLVLLVWQANLRRMRKAAARSTVPEEAAAQPPPPKAYNGLNWLALYFFLCAGLMIFLLTPASAGIWRDVPLLNAMQFPWRTLGLFALASSFLFGFSMYCVGRRWPRALPYAAVVAVLSFAISSLSGLPVDMEPAPVVDAGVIHQMTSLAGWELETTEQQVSLAANVASDLSALRAMTQQPGHLSLDVETSRSTEIALHVLYFKGWKVFVDGQETQPFPIAPRGLLGFSLPAGRHLVEARFELTALRAGAEALSIVCLIILVALLAGLTARRRAVLAPAILAMGLASLFILPHFAARPIPASRFLPVSLPASEGIRLLGVAVEQPNNGRLGLTLFWQNLRSLDSLDMFVSLVDDQGNSIGKPVRQPIDGAYPTEKWLPGEILADRVELECPSAFDAGSTRLNVGFRPPDPSHISPPTAAFRIPLSGGHLTPQSPLPPVVFGDLLGLTSYALASPVAKPGEDFDTRLEWRAMAAIPGNLTAYLHLLEADGKKAWAQVDWPVGPRDYPA